MPVARIFVTIMIQLIGASDDRWQRDNYCDSNAKRQFTLFTNISHHEQSMETQALTQSSFQQTASTFSVTSSTSSHAQISSLHFQLISV